MEHYINQMYAMYADRQHELLLNKRFNANPHECLSQDLLRFQTHLVETLFSNRLLERGRFPKQGRVLTIYHGVPLARNEPLV